MQEPGPRLDAQLALFLVRDGDRPAVENHGETGGERSLVYPLHDGSALAERELLDGDVCELPGAGRRDSVCSFLERELSPHGRV